MLATLREYRDLDSRAWVLACVRTINTGGLSLVMVFMGIYMVRERGLSLTEYGLIILATSIAQSWSQGFAGIISDRIGRRPVMTAALTMRTGVICALGYAVGAGAPVLVLAAILVMSSALRGGFEPVAYAFVADVVKPTERVAAFGLQRLGTNLGWAVGPASGGALLSVLDYGTVFFCAAPALLIAAFIVSQMNEPPRPERSPTEARPSVSRALISAFRDKASAIFLIGIFLTAVSHLQLFTTLSVYAERTLGLSEAKIGRLYSVNAAVVLALQVPAVALIGTIGARAALIAGALVYCLSFFLLGAADAFLGTALAVAVLTVGEVLLAPAQQAIVAELGDAATYGRAFGVMGTMTMLGVAAGPLLGGLAFDFHHGSGLATWATLAVFPAATALAFAWFASHSKFPQAR